MPYASVVAVRATGQVREASYCSPVPASRTRKILEVKAEFACDGAWADKVRSAERGEKVVNSMPKTGIAGSAREVAKPVPGPLSRWIPLRRLVRLPGPCKQICVEM